jgi:uroporphyrinogen-III synthase
MMSGLQGKRIALLEGRMQGELANLVRRHGGIPYSVPALREEALDCREQVATFLDRLGRGAFQVVVCLTGVGVTALVREAEGLGRRVELLEGLNGVTTVCRGPKPVAALHRQGVTVTIQVQAPYTTSELLQAMAGLALQGKGVALLHYGERNVALAEALQTQGAHLDELCLYEWLLPTSLEPLQALVRELIARQVDALAFTSQVQIRHLWHVATKLGLAEALTQAFHTQLIVAVVGPTCAAALTALGVTPHVVPTHPKMGPMVIALAAYLERTATDVRSQAL